MADLTVDLDDLAALGTNLDRARDGLGGALGAMGEANAPPLGTAELDTACAEFQESWTYGLGQLGKCVELVHGGIDRTAATYAEVEGALTQGFAAAAGQLGEEP